MKHLRVTVTEDDIKQGRRRSSAWCPLAIAARRAGAPDPTVVAFRWMPDVLGGRWASLPYSAQLFVRDFDAGRPVQPATFFLPLPEAR